MLSHDLAKSLLDLPNVPVFAEGEECYLRDPLGVDLATLGDGTKIVLIHVGYDDEEE